MDKKSQRKNCIELRKQLTLEDKELKDKAIYDWVYKICEKYATIALYVSKEEEVNTRLLIDSLLKLKKTVVLPKCYQNTLTLHPITSMEDLMHGKYGILEPISSSIDPIHVEMIIVPMVGFDTLNHRLGYGKGYYDRLLSKMDCLKIGLAYEVTKIPLITSEQHDIPCDIIISDKRIYEKNNY